MGVHADAIYVDSWTIVAEKYPEGNGGADKGSNTTGPLGKFNIKKHRFPT